MKFEKSHLFVGIICLFLGSSLGVGGLTLTNQVQPAPIVITPPAPTPTAVPTATPGPINVFINGAVNSPAVYQLAPNSLVEHGIAAAGGFAEGAETAVINLALPLSDGAQIYVPEQGEAAPPPVLAAVPDSRSGNVNVSSGGLININSATAAELEELPGIGPSTAEKIVTHRSDNGAFATIEGIMEVSGIGPAKFEQIKDLITVGQ